MAAPTSPATPAAASSAGVQPAMGVTGLFFQNLMIVSAGLHVYFTYAAVVTGVDILPVTSWFAVFFAVWALRNYYIAGSKKERGQFTMGTIVVGSATRTFSPFVGNVVAIVGCLAVFGSYVFVSTRLSKASLQDIAERLNKTRTWAAIFKAYMLVQGLTWLVILVVLFRQTFFS